MAGEALHTLVVIASLTVAVLAQSQTFLSNPSLAPPTLVVQTNKADLALDGYILVAPFQNDQPSLLIYEPDGTLVWDGLAFVTPFSAYDLTVCGYNGSPHLCFVVGTQFNGFARGQGIILDTSYTLVKTVSSGNGVSLLDMHEFKVIESGSTALITIYEQVEYDLSAFGIQGVSWVTTGIFQEIDIATGNVNFQWSSLDHVPTNESFVLPGTTDISGDGRTNDTAWDYFHINSVDKNSEGDYLISGRHVKTIYKVSGVDGHVIWRLGGTQSDFSMDYEFNFQHDARYRGEHGTTTIISLYNNGADSAVPAVGQTKPGYESESSGIVVVVDTATASSTLLERYISPDRQLSNSQGDLQFLPRGNRLIGMGNLPYIVEFTNNATGTGEVAYYAHLSFEDGAPHSSYRNFKMPWSAQPAVAPDLFAYSHTCVSQVVFYVSWNGATDVASWRFLASNSTDAPFIPVTTVPKTGFETTATFPYFATYAFAEALDATGAVLDRSEITITFVPSSILATSCSEISCPFGTDYSTAANQTCNGTLSPSSTPSSTSVMLNTTMSSSSSSTSSTLRGYGN